MKCILDKLEASQLEDIVGIFDTKVDSKPSGEMGCVHDSGFVDPIYEDISDDEVFQCSQNTPNFE